ncbi:2-polyprenylphenol 6-hydroxylase [Rhodobacter capsulatus]|uniref:2-octaprenylphenol hydroxylase n=1 Tax=Rhodobacter capsulatus TaxID=1061 RepID=A0A0Q0QYF8_RHOCA|nr:2-polyprenylphenol 6-hydroxylase [Rhodobacter capsulatus]KQB14586.1 2-octaprenylphenol hydroxylase [Rhodobacter capsulatus]KQB14885.1 2-octaprenylphenol hydroxylase [Rhodobacter capsulatus]PZX25028.1 2-octaprenylphenol hydroxylase [Rhodobacter capsulatus]QNR63262.1 2-polyprenylphenol 6-hydroxylase [Rhodobacter capsulatus]WER09396.1 2-polyprenylphenol 6-hydroxylase [Rhodobacter capsulatus]
MRGPHNLWRLIRTGATFERTGAMRVALEAMEAPPRLRLVARIMGWPFKWLGYAGDPALPPVTRAITALGPAYIKLGQVLSTRPDVVGEELADQLRVLQDRLPPFDIALAKATLVEEFGRPFDELFSEFSEPVAAASIAQVHSARLLETGEKVAVKVLRPGIEKAFKRDIDAFHFAANMIERLSPASRRLRPSDVIKHFEDLVAGELDLRLEAAAASQFAANTEKDAGFRVPLPVWSLSSRRVMVIDWAEGLPMGDPDRLKAAGHDVTAIGTRVLQLFLSHALRDGYFHGDMHQGNLKVAENGDIIAFDFGIMGQIDQYTRHVYAEILMGFIHRDYRRVAEVHFEAGYIPPDQDVVQFALALRAVGEPIFGMNAKQISMARLLAYLFEVTERFGMATRTELILLQRTMVVVEGVARSLNPGINMWETAKPVVESYIRENVGPRGILRDLTRTARVLGRFGPQLPELMQKALERQVQPEAKPEPKAAQALGAVSAVLILAAGVALGLLI